jgi:3-oxoacyl-[acyl-carrier protein] reductase
MTDSDSEWIIVSGANGSLGSNLVDRFLGRGRKVLALDLQEIPARDAARGGRLVSRAVDLADDAAVKTTLDEAIPRSEPIGLLVNAVGLIWNEPVLTLSGANFKPHGAATWRKVIDANLTAPFVIASLVAARMARKGGGAIINFSSISGRGNVGQSAYSAAKAGIEGLTRTMAAELGPIGIRVNAIAPGFIDAPSTRAALSDEQLKALRTRTPAGRLGQIDELLNAIDFLAENAFVTGVVLDVNGGLRL